MQSGVLKCECAPLSVRGSILAATMEWAVLCQMSYVQLFRVPLIFFSPDSSPCAQHSVSWSQTCRALYATDCLRSWEHEPGALPVTFLIILQMNFPWLLEWELKPEDGIQPFLVFPPTCREENQHPQVLSNRRGGPRGDLRLRLAQLVVCFFWGNCHFDHSRQDMRYWFVGLSGIFWVWTYGSGPSELLGLDNSQWCVKEFWVEYCPQVNRI